MTLKILSVNSFIAFFIFLFVIVFNGKGQDSGLNLNEFHFQRNSAGENTPRMIIVTHDQFYNTILPFAEHKNRRGIKTEIIKLSEIGLFPDAQDIKNYLSTLMEGYDSIPYYLLLVGDADLLPAFYGIGNSLNDHEYATLDSLDFLADIFTGRFSVNSMEECEIYVQKTINYENIAGPADSLSWCRSATVAASDANLDDMHGRHLVAELSHAGFSPVDDFRASLHNFTSPNIIQAINEGRSWMLYLGLGDPASWYVTGGFTTYTIANNIQNQNKLPAVISIGCSSADFDYSNGYCLGERWMNAGISRGAIVFLGATETTPFFLSDTLGKYTFLSYLHGESETFGSAMVYGKMKMSESFRDSFSDSVIQECMQHFLILGDPSLMPWTDIPQKALTDIKVSKNNGKYVMQIALQKNDFPVKRALLCVSNPDFSIYHTAYTDDSGKAVFFFNEEDTTMLNLSVSGRNLLVQHFSFRLPDMVSVPEKESRQQQFYIYPNPVQEFMYIFSENDVLLDIYTCFGQFIKSEKIQKGTSFITCSGLPAGLYLIKMHSDRNNQIFKFYKE